MSHELDVEVVFICEYTKAGLVYTPVKQHSAKNKRIDDLKEQKEAIRNSDVDK